MERRLAGRNGRTEGRRRRGGRAMRGIRRSLAAPDARDRRETEREVREEGRKGGVSFRPPRGNLFSQRNAKHPFETESGAEAAIPSEMRPTAEGRTDASRQRTDALDELQ